MYVTSYMASYRAVTNIIMMVVILESIINVGHTDHLVDPCVAENDLNDQNTQLRYT